MPLNLERNRLALYHLFHISHQSTYHSYYHVISQPDFCSSRSIFFIFDLITDADADKSEFFTEPGITIPLMLGEHILNINLAY